MEGLALGDDGQFDTVPKDMPQLVGGDYAAEARSQHDDDRLAHANLHFRAFLPEPTETRLEMDQGAAERSAAALSGLASMISTI